MAKREEPARAQEQNRRHPQKRSKRKSNLPFVCFMVVFSFTLSVVFSYSSSLALKNAHITAAMAILLVFIFIGILFDIIGVAATSSDEKTFHSMAAHRVPGAKEGIWLLKNAERVASMCNDVVGDICGVISGATGATITVMLVTDLDLSPIITPLVVTGCIAALTIGGKAMGKSIAVNQGPKVVFLAARIIHFFGKIFRRGA